MVPRPWRAARRVPKAAWVCALVACLNGVCWSFITPPFEVPDEPDHFAYVKQLAETGTRPTSSEESLSREEALALVAVHYPQVRLHPATRAIFSQAQQRGLEAELQALAQLPEKGSPHAGVATSEPPLYYALESVPYILGSSGTLLDRLQLMRLLSALMAGLTALFTFMFLREALPAARWAWTVGALCVALSPLFGFMSGAVNPDAMLFAVSAALFYCLARAFRRGLTQRSGIATGLVIATGFMVKLNFVGLAPGAFLALLLLAVRGARSSGRAGLRAPVVAAAIGCSPIALLVLTNTLSGHPALGIVASAINKTHGSLLAEANYMWQLYLPRLPGTVNDFPGLFTARQIWFDGYVGRFGWLDTFFPAWVYTLALVPAGLIVCLFVRALIACRELLRERTSELAVYAAMAGGMLVLVGADSYLVFPKELAEYGQARYLLPLLPLLGAVLALSARAAGRRWGPTVGALMVLLFLAHDIFGQLQVVARYYG
jgi:4-amino-4-deoxy-L-arabinose transferase-like glycosyltransferase